MMQTVCRREAERFRRYWQRRYGSAPRVMRDVDVGRSDMDDAHMVLIGGPDINAQTAQLADALPVEFEDEGFRFGGRLYTEPDQGLLLCYPHPDRPGRLVALAHGNSPAPLFQSLDRFGLWVYGGVLGSREWFDFGVFDARTAGPETFLHVGFFDNEWKPPGAGSGGWELRRGGQGPATAEQGFPEFHTVSEAAVARGEAADSLHLSDLLPERIDQPIGAVGINRAYDGGPVHMGMAVYEKGLGVKVPSRISYHLGGMYDQFSSVVTLTHGFKGEPMGARREHEKVVFEVWGDGKLLVQSSELDWVAKHRMATRINADIRDVFELELVVRPVGDAPTWLYGAAAWCAPVISR
jgi:hypothetical protein